MWQARQAEIAIEGRPHDAGPVEVKGESAGESLQDRLEQARQGWAVGRQVNFFLDRRDLDRSRPSSGQATPLWGCVSPRRLPT
jgi:hypothetical protein